MKTADIRLKLHQLIDTLEDKKAVAIYTLFENEISVEMKRKSLIDAERNNYLSGKGKNYSWSEIKDMALHKEKRHGL